MNIKTIPLSRMVTFTKHMVVGIYHSSVPTPNISVLENFHDYIGLGLVEEGRYWLANCWVNSY